MKAIEEIKAFTTELEAWRTRSAHMQTLHNSSAEVRAYYRGREAALNGVIAMLNDLAERLGADEQAGLERLRDAILSADYDQELPAPVHDYLGALNEDKEAAFERAYPSGLRQLAAKEEHKHPVAPDDAWDTKLAALSEQVQAPKHPADNDDWIDWLLGQGRWGQ